MHRRMVHYSALVLKEGLIHAFGKTKNQRRSGACVYLGLFGYADHSGCYEPNYATIANTQGLLNYTAKEVEHYVNILIEQKKILTYRTESGKVYHWIINFLEHQRLNNPGPPTIPLPEWIQYGRHKYPNGKEVSVYKVDISKLPVDYQHLFKDARSSLLVASISERKGREGNKRSGGADAPLLSPTLQGVCSQLISHFKLPTEPDESKAQFHPIGFIKKARKADVPIDVIEKILNSLAEQKNNIRNPYAWLVTVVNQECANYNFQLSVAESEENKKPSGVFQQIGKVFGVGVGS